MSPPKPPPPRRAACPIEGVCLYPVLGHTGWDDERYCPNGPIDITPGGGRAIHPPSRAAIARMRTLLD